jgi:hypothetical protein
MGDVAMTAAERQRRRRQGLTLSRGLSMPATNTALLPTPPALPTTSAAYLAHRKLKARRSINDHVEEVHLKLIDDERYSDYLFAIYDEQAVEKSLEIDDFMAALMLRDKARELNNDVIGHESLAVIVKALRVVLRRYEFSRRERRNSVSGVSVPEETPQLETMHEHIGE